MVILIIFIFPGDRFTKALWHNLDLGVE